MAITNVLLVVFIGITALSLLIQLFVLAGIARKLGELSEYFAPLLPQLEKTVRAVTPLLEETQKLVAETRPKLATLTTNLAEISTLTRDQVRRADAFATQMGERIELQMVRVDDALSSAMANLEEITTTLRDTVLRPVRDMSAVFQGVRTGLDFFLRRRSSPARRATYQDEEMFI